MTKLSHARLLQSVPVCSRSRGRGGRKCLTPERRCIGVVGQPFLPLFAIYALQGGLVMKIVIILPAVTLTSIGQGILAKRSNIAHPVLVKDLQRTILSRDQ
jgi:hypothetical protein